MRKENLKLLLSACIFALSGLFFINTAPAMMNGDTCKDCGSFEGCYEGNPTNQYGWENCEIVSGSPPCEVSGEYGPCNPGGGTSQ